jgi:hypothetical protein
MERQPPAGIMDRGRLGHATPNAEVSSTSAVRHSLLDIGNSFY